MRNSPSGGLTDEPFPTLSQPNLNVMGSAGSSTAAFTPLSTGPGLVQVLGDRLLADANRIINVTDIKADIIGIYFSAHWCPPCRNFTPRLASLYRIAMQRRKSFEIVFASRDRSQSDFIEYYGQMPWKAFLFSDQVRIQTLMTIWKIRGIPSLVLIDKMGNTLQSTDVVRMIGQFPDNFLARLPDSQTPRVVEQSIPPPDPAVATMNIDDLFRELEDDQSLNQDQRYQALSTVRTLLSNIDKDPSNPKYRRINKENKNISEKVLKYPVLVKLLKVSGFRETPTTLVAPLSIPLPDAFQLVLTTINALVESLDGSPPHISQKTDPAQKSGSNGPPDYECKDGVCRRINDAP